ncbi:hypothetical protein GLYMA_10G093266v4 [Glycine max]|nr:hypothetical protein GLYMA_10G093266v4 [Glycine max]
MLLFVQLPSSSLLGLMFTVGLLPPLSTSHPPLFPPKIVLLRHICTSLSSQ